METEVVVARWRSSSGSVAGGDAYHDDEDGDVDAYEACP